MQDAQSQPSQESIIVEAKKFIPEPDYICDLFSLQFVWASEHALEATGYTQEDARQMKILDVLDDSYDEKAYRHELIERIARGEGESQYIIKHKSGGKLKVSLKYHVFEYNERWYVTAKILKFDLIQETAQ